jgi:glycosyltransferase involved in cell wall biosynthesis
VEKRIDRYVLKRADLVAAGNEDIRQYALANGASEDRTTVFLVGHLIEPVHFLDEPEQRADVRGELGLGDRPFVVCVSRLERVKHPEDVLLVLAEARRKVPALAGVLVGDGAMRGELERKAVELGLEEDVIFAGNRDQRWIARALASAAVVLSPLTGRALVEAALSGTAIVAYDIDWQSELVRSGETGVLVPFRDTRRMAEATCELLANEELAATLGKRARSVAFHTMDPGKLVRHEQAEYQKLLRLSGGNDMRRRSKDVRPRASVR